MRMTDVERRMLKGGAGLAGSLPDMNKVPVRVPRPRAAELVTERFFKVSPRSLERAPLQWRLLNGRAHVETAELFAWAQEVLDAAPAVAGGHRRAPERRAA